MANADSEVMQDLWNGAVGAVLGALLGIILQLFNFWEFSWAIVGGAAIVCFVLAFLAGEIVLKILKEGFRWW